MGYGPKRYRTCKDLLHGFTIRAKYSQRGRLRVSLVAVLRIFVTHFYSTHITLADFATEKPIVVPCKRPSVDSTIGFFAPFVTL